MLFRSLAVSLTFGGREVHGPGFAVPIVLRYLLETCDTVGEALGRLASTPVAIPQNLTLVDAERAVTVYVGPDMPMTEAPDACAANHQLRPVSDAQERATRTGQRLAAVRATDPADVAAMLRPPLHKSDYDGGLGTVYTAHYRPGAGQVSYHWPDMEPWTQSFGAFVPGERSVALGGASVTDR